MSRPVVTFAKRDFELTCDRRPEAMLVEHYRKGKPNLFIDTRQGDGPMATKPGDPQRNRADGYISRFPYGSRIRMVFWIMLLEHCDAKVPFSWFNLAEIHGFKGPGAGPFKLEKVFSDGNKAEADRVTKQWLKPNGELGSAPISRQSMTLVPGNQHRIEAEIYIHNTDGYAWVEQAHRPVAGDFTGLGYSEKLEYGLHWGTYRSDRATRSKMRMALDEFEFLKD